MYDEIGRRVPVSFPLISSSHFWPQRDVSRAEVQRKSLKVFLDIIYCAGSPDCINIETNKLQSPPAGAGGKRGLRTAGVRIESILWEKSAPGKRCTVFEQDPDQRELAFESVRTIRVRLWNY